MHRLVLPTAAFVALLARVNAGVADSWAPAEVIAFVDGDWEDKCEGEIFPIKWSKGNGKEVVAKVKGHGWEEEICANGAAPGGTEWEVEVPKCDVEYSIWLKQEDCEELESPKFRVNCAEEEESGHGGWGDHPTVTVVWDDEECKCQKTKTTVAPTPSKHIWWDEDLKCTVTETTVDPVKPTGNGWDKPVDPAKPTGNGWDKPADPAKPTGNGWDKPVDPAHTASGNGWDKPVADASAAASGNGWDKPVAPATSAPVAPASSAAGGDWNKPVAPATGVPSSPVGAYHGAATKVGASAFAMVAVFAAALAL